MNLMHSFIFHRISGLKGSSGGHQVHVPSQSLWQLQLIPLPFLHKISSVFAREGVKVGGGGERH